MKKLQVVTALKLLDKLELISDLKKAHNYTDAMCHFYDAAKLTNILAGETDSKVRIHTSESVLNKFKELDWVTYF